MVLHFVELNIKLTVIIIRNQEPIALFFLNKADLLWVYFSPHYMMKMSYVIINTRTNAHAQCL